MNVLIANTFTYDANGNILTQMRADVNGVNFDELTYHYLRNDDNYVTRNRLYHVTDPLGQVQGTDIIGGPGQMDPNNLETTGNYGYDELGQLIRDAEEEIEHIAWRVDGKIHSITCTAGSAKPDLEFVYDALGNRIAKKVIPEGGGVEITYYIRDAQGNVMSTYNITSARLTQHEQHIYGSSRLGMRLAQPLVGEATLYGATYGLTRGHKRYELSNHLGNVLSVITDRKNGEGRFWPHVLSHTDYYPGGMLMPGRNFNLGSYRYGGAGGQEMDNEISGVGNSYTAEYWQYDSRLVRRWNRDPVVKAWQSSYAAFDNNPIYYNDPSGAVAEGPCDGCPAVTLPEVVITAKAPSKFGNFLKGIGDFFSKVGEGLKELGTHTAIFATGAVNAWASNQMFGAGRGNPQDFGPYAGTAQAGQTFGDIASIVTGAGEVLLGAGEEVVGVALNATGVGAVIGIPLNVAGVATGFHGSTVIGTASANMIKDGVNRTHDNMHGSPSSGGSKSGGNYKKLSSNKSANEYSQSKGYKDAHDLKRSHVGKGNESKFDIEVDSKTGQGRLISKDGRTTIDID